MKVQSVSCITDVLSEVISAEENSRVVSSELLLKNCFDSITLLGHACKSISNLRKKNLKPSLNPQYQILCNPNRTTTQFLLGDDLNKGMQEAQESKLAKSFSLDRRHAFKGSSSSTRSKYRRIYVTNISNLCTIRTYDMVFHD